MRPAGWHLLACVLVTAPSCGSDSSSGVVPGADELIHSCDNRPDAAAATLATDESFVAIVNAEAAKGLTRDDANAPVLALPAAGASLSVSTPPKFEWRPTMASAGPVNRIEACPRETMGVGRWAAVIRALSPIGVAHAHCGAVTGENFLFRLEASGRPLYTALLSVSSFTPDAAKWSKALGAHAGKTVTLILARAYLAQGTVIEGPYVGSPVTFTLQR